MSLQEVTLAIWDTDELAERIPGEWSGIDSFDVFWDTIESRLVITALVERLDPPEDTK